MSKYNSSYGTYCLGTKRVTRREWIISQHGEKIADTADRGPYWLGEARNLTSFLPVLTVWRKTEWPRDLDLDKVFPFDAEKLTEGWQGYDGLALFLAESKLVQADFKTTAAGIGEQYDKLRATYFRTKKRAPGVIADLRAEREECGRVLVRYARRVASYLVRVRPAIAVLWLETRKVIVADPAVPAASLPKEIRNDLWHAHFVFAQRFWGNVLNGGPSSLDDADDLAAQLQFPQVSEELVQFQCGAIYDLLEGRDEVITEALPVAYRRVACESILWKIAHGEPVARWSGEDEEKAREEHRKGAGNPGFIAGALSENTRKKIFEAYERRMEEDRRGYLPTRPGALVSERMKAELSDELEIPESTIGDHLRAYLSGGSG